MRRVWSAQSSVRRQSLTHSRTCTRKSILGRRRFICPYQRASPCTSPCTTSGSTSALSGASSQAPVYIHWVTGPNAYYKTRLERRRDFFHGAQTPFPNPAGETNKRGSERWARPCRSSRCRAPVVSLYRKGRESRLSRIESPTRGVYVSSRLRLFGVGRWRVSSQRYSSTVWLSRTRIRKSPPQDQHSQNPTSNHTNREPSVRRRVAKLGARTRSAKRVPENSSDSTFRILC